MNAADASSFRASGVDPQVRSSGSIIGKGEEKAKGRKRLEAQ